MKSKTSYLKFYTNYLNKFFLCLIDLYVYFKPIIKKYPTCRFDPCCSTYSILCFKKFNFFKALFFTIVRLLKCHPFGSYGYDPVPESLSRSSIIKGHNYEFRK